MQTSKSFYRVGMYVLFQIATLSGYAQQASGQNTSYPDYYSVSQNPASIGSSPSMDPHQALQSLTQSLAATAIATYSLLKWDRAGKPLPNPIEPYNRDKHFGGWIDDGRDNNCLDTRAKILVLNSRVPVTYTDAKKCVVATGEWLDPYTHQVLRNASDIQIDHFIPLKQAYITGAWTWNRKLRCLYGNYLFNQMQLLAVSSSENQSKSDHAPDEYMPPYKPLWCAYLANWLKIKLIWNLVMTPPEAQGIANLFTAARCNAKDFQLTTAELQKQRSTIVANALYCDYDVSHKP